MPLAREPRDVHRILFQCGGFENREGKLTRQTGTLNESRLTENDPRRLCPPHAAPLPVSKIQTVRLKQMKTDSVKFTNNSHNEQSNATTQRQKCTPSPLDTERETTVVGRQCGWIFNDAIIRGEVEKICQKENFMEGLRKNTKKKNKKKTKT